MFRTCVIDIVFQNSIQHKVSMTYMIFGIDIFELYVTTFVRKPIRSCSMQGFLKGNLQIPQGDTAP